MQQKTAIPLEVAARFQINILVEPIQSISIYQKVQKKFMPILWFEQHVIMSEDIANEVKMILSFPAVGQTMGAIFVVIGLILIIINPLRNIFIRKCCVRHCKVTDLDKMTTNENAPQLIPEISPLIYNPKVPMNVTIVKLMPIKSK